MSTGREYSRFQKGIINRYYEHRDTISLQKLSEAVSELYLAETEKKRATLWKGVATALQKTAANPARVKKILDEKDLGALAQLINELTVG